MAFPQQGRWGIYDVTALIGEGGGGHGSVVVLIRC